MAVLNPSRIRILAVGKVRKGWVNEGVALYLKRLPGLEIVAYVKSIHDLQAEVDPETVTFAQAEANIVRCPDAAMAEKMIASIPTMVAATTT